MHPDAQPVISAQQVYNISRGVIETVHGIDSNGEAIGAQTPPQIAYLEGWFEALRRQARGVLVLTDTDLDYECAALLRGMVEHAVLIKQVADEPDA